MPRATTVKVPVFLGRNSKGGVSYQGCSLLLPLLSIWYLVGLRLDIWGLIRISIYSVAKWLYVPKPSTIMTSPSLKLFLHVSLILMLSPMLLHLLLHWFIRSVLLLVISKFLCSH